MGPQPSQFYLLLLNWKVVLSFTVLLIVFYVIYQRLLHPLAKYPGPILASLTNIWKSYWVYNLCLHEKLVELHETYGPVIRIGPNALHFWEAEAIAPIYRGGKSMGKTDFYNAFTTFNPNLFGTTDEAKHSLRRRQLSHGFSQVSIQKMEPIIDGNLKILIHHLQVLAKTGEVFDMKNMISCFVLDILGDVAFSRSFGAQVRGRADDIQAINDHIFLACVIGEFSSTTQTVLKKLINWSPISWIRRLIKSRAHLKETCADCVRYRIQNPSDRRDLLSSLIVAKDPETGERLTELDINTEAFAMLVAGSHSTSGTLSFLFCHLLQNRNILAQVVNDIDTNLGRLDADQMIYPIAGLEAKLDYTAACILENFRMNPVFSMNLWRQVPIVGVQIGDHFVPSGTHVCISNYVLHHNPRIWGYDHNVFNPGRWSGPEEKNRAKTSNLIQFSTGHRMCIGRNLAMTNILKTVTTLLGLFEFQLVSPLSEIRLESAGIGELKGDLHCRVKLREK